MRAGEGPLFFWERGGGDSLFRFVKGLDIDIF